MNITGHEVPWLWEFNGEKWGFDPRLPRAHELEQFTLPSEIQEQIVNDHHLKCIRKVRNELLAETDWWANSDLTMTAEQTAYRQALRDITDTYTSLDDVVWPTKP